MSDTTQQLDTTVSQQIAQQAAQDLSSLETLHQDEINDKKRDFLVIDPQVPGQDWCVLSFITPTDLERKRQLYLMDHFLAETINEYIVSSTRDMCRRINAKFFKEMNDKIEQLKASKNPNHDVIAKEMHKIRKELETNEEEFATLCTHQHKLDLEDTQAKFEDFVISHGEKLNEEFSKQNGHQVSMMGIKFSGAFPFKEQAEERAQFLAENVERGVDHFVGQSFYWLPFNPDPNAIKDRRYQNQELNRLMEEKRQNEEMRNQYFEERKREMVEEAKSKNQTIKDRLKEKYKNREKK